MGPPDPPTWTDCKGPDFCVFPLRDGDHGPPARCCSLPHDAVCGGVLCGAASVHGAVRRGVLRGAAVPHVTAVRCAAGRVLSGAATPHTTSSASNPFFGPTSAAAAAAACPFPAAAAAAGPFPPAALSAGAAFPFLSAATAGAFLSAAVSVFAAATLALRLVAMLSFFLGGPLELGDGDLFRCGETSPKEMSPPKQWNVSFGMATGAAKAFRCGEKAAVGRRGIEDTRVAHGTALWTACILC